MKLRWITCAALLLLGAYARALDAQPYRWDITLNGGWGITTAALGDDGLGFNQGSLGFDNNWMFGGQFGFWISRRVGVRLNGSYTSTPFMQGDDLTLFDDINLWSGTGDLLVRFVEPRPRWSGTEWLPYFTAGLGAHWVNPPGDHYIVAEEFDDDFPEEPLEIEGPTGVPIVCNLGLCRGPASPGFPGIGGIPVPGTRTFFLEEGASLAGLLGLGLDLRLAPSFALRLEFGDLIWDAPFDEVAQRENLELVVRPLSDVVSTVHQFYATLGASVLFGLRSEPRRERVVVLPAPPPPPPPPPARPAPRPRPRPAPPPPRPRPTSEDISVCVVNPSVAGGLQMITAQRSLTTGDTTVRGRSLSSVSSSIPVAEDADWYIRGAPFEIGDGQTRLLFTVTGSAQTLSPSALVYIGTVNRLPVFARRSGIPAPLDRLGPSTDLSQAMAQSASIHNALNRTPMIYVPLQATGCVFLALVQQEAIRKK